MMDGTNLTHHTIRGLGGIIAMLEQHQNGGVPVNEQAVLDLEHLRDRLDNVILKGKDEKPKKIESTLSWDEHGGQTHERSGSAQRPAPAGVQPADAKPRSHP